VYLKNRFGLALALYVSCPPVGNPIVIIPLDNVIIEREDATMISIKQPSNMAIDYFLLQVSPKLVDDWLFTLNKINKANTKNRPTLPEPIPGVCADRLVAKHQCHFSSDILFKDVPGEPVSWMLRAGRFEDFIIWSLYTCTSLESDNLVLTSLLLYVSVHATFDQFFTQFVQISKTCLESRYASEFHHRLDCMGSQVARSFKLLEREEIYRFVEFCSKELHLPSSFMLKQYKSHKLSKKVCKDTGSYV
jgi:hypothetical protein